MYTWDIMQETHLLHNDYVYAWLSSNTRIGRYVCGRPKNPHFFRFGKSHFICIPQRNFFDGRA